MWAEPHNKNKLEKTTLSRQGIGAQSKEMKDEGLVRLLSNKGPSNACACCQFRCRVDAMYQSKCFHSPLIADRKDDSTCMAASHLYSTAR